MSEDYTALLTGESEIKCQNSNNNNNRFQYQDKAKKGWHGINYNYYGAIEWPEKNTKLMNFKLKNNCRDQNGEER